MIAGPPPGPARGGSDLPGPSGRAPAPRRRPVPGLRGGLGAGLLLLLAACASDPALERTATPRPTRGAVVAEHPLAVAAGLEILDAGGNAADAAVATALALAVVYPQAGNLGGGGFALWVPAEGPGSVIDFRETAPAQADPARYLDEAGDPVALRSLVTPLAVGVPGTPEGLLLLWETHGSGLRLETLAAPAVRLAKEGFAVDAWLAHDLRRPTLRLLLQADPGASALFYPGGEPLEEGQLLVQADLARTIERLASGRRAAFYEGLTANAILEALRDADARTGGHAGGAGMTLEDLEGYEALRKEPLVGWFRGKEVLCVPPPGSGGVVLLQVLGMLEGLALDAEREGALARALSGREPGVGPDGVSARALHWWIEALRRAFADRAEHLGDPDHAVVPTAELLSPAWIARRRVSIGERADPEVRPWVAPPPEGRGETTHLSVLDDEGNAVSLTTTLNGTFGSGIYVRGSGFLLNNELDDFSIRPGVPNMFGLVGSEANQLAPYRRPLSSMSPTVVRDGGRGVRLVIGAPGGPRIITAVFQVLLRHLVYGQDLADAVRAPRLHQQWKPTYTRFEGAWEPELLRSLELRHGHELRVEPDARFGSVQAIAVDPDGTPRPVSDPRRGGVAGVQGEPLPEPARPPSDDAP